MKDHKFEQGELFEDMIDYYNYTAMLSSCEIRTWNKFNFTAAQVLFITPMINHDDKWGVLLLNKRCFIHSIFAKNSSLVSELFFLSNSHRSSTHFFHVVYFLLTSSLDSPSSQLNTDKKSYIPGHKLCLFSF